MIRIDKWLWAARFFKTRSLAKKMVEQGKVKIGGQKCKPSRNLEVGDQLTIQKSETTWIIDVVELSERRGPAKVAQTLYQETAESVKQRESATLLRKMEFQSTPRPEKRPTKKQRRDIKKFRNE
ncbi:RNA-binding S4 domain-containing protein [Marinicella sediminis]|uniref:Heat shock protein 15 n=1 Tax=Marinicella sediminis TaxID=1792834 RepID=A0ABV7J9N9_9GAMM|nr:S4 domain-containing protein [Marinicella sediminis]